MTFKQIENEGKTYVNKYGIVFTPYPKLEKIMVTYNIDSETTVGLIKPSQTLNVLLKSPGKVDYLMLSKFQGV